MTPTRPPIIRILRIHQVIEEGLCPNVPALSRILGVSGSTIHRDIEYLREQLGAPLAFNPLEGGYEYTEEGFRLPDVQMTEGELLALMIEDRALAAYRGTESESLLRLLLNKAIGTLDEKRTVSPQQIARSYSFRHTTPPSRVAPGVFGAIEKAIRDRMTLEIVYAAEKRGEAGRRRIDPYHLANVDADWYLIAFCHKSDGIRVFKPAKIKSARATGQHYVPRGFDPAEFLRTKIGAMGGDRIFEVVIRFDTTLAGHVLERDWGAGYRVQTLVNGGVELSFRSENADAVIRWTLGWGPGTEIISPPWVRRRARQILNQVRKIYEGNIRHVRPAKSPRI